MRYLLFILLPTHFCSSQQPTTCWECIIAAQNLDLETALARCQQANSLSQQEKEIVHFVLGRLELNAGNYDQAIDHLTNTLSTNDPFLKALTYGLIGDCYLEKNDTPIALIHFKSAHNLSEDTNFELYFLHKQGICFSLLDQPDEHRQISSLIKMKQIKNQENYIPFSFLYTESTSQYDIINKTRIKRPLAGPYGIGLYRGEKVDDTIFNSIYEEMVELNTSYVEIGVPLKEERQLLNESWSSITRQLLLNRYRDGFTLDISKDELFAHLTGEKGYAPHPSIQSSFSDLDGTFRKDLLLEQISYYENSSDSYEQKAWKDLKNAIEKEIEYNKFIILCNQGIYVTTIESNLYNRSISDQLFIEIIETRPLYAKKIQVSEALNEAAIETYFEQQKYAPEYAYDSERQLQIISVPIQLTSQDSLLLVDEFITLKDPFEKALSDSLFFEQHPDLIGYKGIAHLPETHSNTGLFTYPDQLNSTLIKAKKGEVVGPYWDDNHICLAKVTGFSNILATARHILIPCSPHADPKVREDQLRLTQEILSQTNHSNFDSLVKQYSADPGSNQTGGILEDFFPEYMVPTFSDFCSKEKIGKIGYVESDFGFHIIEVLERKKVKYPRLSVIRKEIQPDFERIKEEQTKIDRIVTDMNDYLKDLSYSEQINYIDSVATHLSANLLEVAIKDVHPQVDNLLIPTTIENELLQFAFTHNPVIAGQTIVSQDQFLIPILTGIYDGQVNYQQVYKQVKQDYQHSVLFDSIIDHIRQIKDVNTFIEEFQLTRDTVVYSKIDFGIQHALSPEAIDKIYTNQDSITQPYIFKNNDELLMFNVIKRVINTVESEQSDNIKEIILQHWSSVLIKSGEGSNNGTTIINYPLYFIGVRK